jgi:hypothetical protein
MNFEEPELIATGDLEFSDLPCGRMNWNKFSSFALTFDPKKEHLTADDLAAVGEKIPSARHNVKVLRAILYNWQRIWNNTTEEPPASFFIKVNDVVELMKNKITGRDEN